MRVRWLAASIATLVLVAGSGYAWLAASQRPCASNNSSMAADAECEAPAGAANGSFDPVMSSVCRFSCATQEPYEAKDVVAQPDALAGRLTRCPVSGVVFTVDADRPRTLRAGHEFVFCCDQCRAKFAKNPTRFVKA